MFGLFLQILRAATGGLGGLALGVAINFSFDGQRQSPLTYVGVYAAAGLLFVACGAVWVWIHRRQTRQAPSPPEPVVQPQAAENERRLRRQVRRVHSEVDASRKTVNDALDTGHFWNVGVTRLQFGEWEGARDLLADELPTIHDKVATAYVLVESMNAIANSHRRAERFDERAAEQLKRLRAKLREAQDALRAYLEQQEEP